MDRPRKTEKPNKDIQNKSLAPSRIQWISRGFEVLRGPLDTDTGGDSLEKPHEKRTGAFLEANRLTTELQIVVDTVRKGTQPRDKGRRNWKCGSKGRGIEGGCPEGRKREGLAPFSVRRSKLAQQRRGFGPVSWITKIGFFGFGNWTVEGSTG